MYETGLDESLLIGTREQIRALGEHMIRLSEAEGSKEDYLGVNVIMIPGGLTEVSCDVVLDGVVITESELDTRELINRIYRNNGENGVDWG